MYIGNNSHLTYCTNIHPAETWPEVFTSLQKYALPLKQRISPGKAFGIGLRLSSQASIDLLQESKLAEFRAWLDENDLYVFTLNGFPYGGFHRQVVKDDVHRPDWTTRERTEYIIRLCRILAQLLPAGMEGGISTSPISYRLWYKNNQQALNEAFRTGCRHLAEVVAELVHIRKQSGKLIHIDIEPEPDGLIDHTADTIDFFLHKLIPLGSAYLQEKQGIPASEAEQAIRTHVQVCYDVCHFAVMYENPREVINSFKAAGIGIGKVQLSAALKARLPEEAEGREKVTGWFAAFAESTYLHQVVARTLDHSHVQYPDLPQALAHIQDQNTIEWRTHFHVPIFLKDYHTLQSTQEDIVEVLHLHRQQPFTRHLEVETYTWEVLPESIKLDLGASLEREMQWVMGELGIED
jgi:sugar phosphate isomerase/epimerase